MSWKCMVQWTVYIKTQCCSIRYTHAQTVHLQTCHEFSMPILEPCKSEPWTQQQPTVSRVFFVEESNFNFLPSCSTWVKMSIRSVHSEEEFDEVQGYYYLSWLLDKFDVDKKELYKWPCASSYNFFWLRLSCVKVATWITHAPTSKWHKIV